MVSQRVKKRIALTLGLSVDDLIDQLYGVVDGGLSILDDLECCLGVSLVDANWNSDLSTDHDAGFRVVWGHPLLGLSLVDGDNVRFFRLPEGATRELFPVVGKDGNFRSQTITLLLENELRDDAPEFDQELLRKIVKSNSSESIRVAAVGRITGQRFLEKAAKRDSDSRVRLAAVRKITYQRVLKRIAESNSYYSVQLAAIDRITDQTILHKIAESSPYPKIQRAARERLE